MSIPCWLRAGMSALVSRREPGGHPRVTIRGASASPVLPWPMSWRAGAAARLQEWPARRSRPAAPFGGKSRIIYFPLSTALNSGIRHIAVATQYKSQSLIRHLRSVWDFVCAERDESFDILPSSQRVREGGWYAGTADAVYQNIDIIERYKPQHVLILAGDHVYKMDYEAMLQQHV